MALLSDPQHEAFAQARFAGQPLEEAHRAAGYAGDKASASRLSHLFEVKERIAELYREAATQAAYEKTHAVRDLLAIIHACPSEAQEDHPLCEVRMGKDGPHHRFPPKLQAMARLMKLMGWNEPVKVEVELKDNLKDLLVEMRSGRAPQESATSRHAKSGVARHSGVETQGRAPQKPNATTKNAATERPQPPIGYQKADAIRDLVVIIHGHPSAAGPDHPLCEARMSAWGPYHRFPSKLGAITLLVKMLGWNGPMKLQMEHDPDAGFKALREWLRHRS